LNDEVTFIDGRDGGRVTGAAFSHSVIEVMDEGRIVL
jgi:hypothetical protein